MLCTCQMHLSSFIKYQKLRFIGRTSCYYLALIPYFINTAVTVNEILTRTAVVVCQFFLLL